MTTHEPTNTPIFLLVFAALISLLLSPLEFVHAVPSPSDSVPFCRAVDFEDIRARFNIDASKNDALDLNVGEPRTVRMIYFLPSDRAPQQDIDTKLDMLMKDVQQSYAEVMEYHGFGRRTFKLETDATGKARVHHVNGKFNDEHYHTDTFNKVIWEETAEQFDLSANIYFVVLDVSNAVIDGYCGQGGSYGPEAGIVLLPAPNSSLERERGWSCFNVAVAAHELGHAFGLAHDHFRNATRSPSSYHTDWMVTSFCAAEWLDAHPYLNIGQSYPEEDEPTTIQMLSPLAVPPNAIRLRFEVTDPDGLHQAQLHNSTGEAIDCQGIDGKGATVEFVTTEVTETGNSVQLRIADVYGNVREESYPIDIAALPPPQVVSIRDANLAAVVQEVLGLTPGNAISQLDLLRLRGLEATDRQIMDLTGLEYAVNLKQLLLGHNQISDITQLEGMTILEELELYNNNISDISSMAEMTNLSVLRLQANSVGDLSPLAGLVNLGELNLSHNSVGDLSPLAGLIHLRRLNLAYNSVSDLSPLIGLTHLRELDLRNNPLSYQSINTHIPAIQSRGVTVQFEDPFEDPSNFTGEDLEGRRLTLRLEVEEGTAGIVELRFGEGNRFEQIELGASPRSGNYAYRRTGTGMGTITLDYDDGASCELRLSFTESGVGGFAYDCGQGDPAEGSFRLTTGSLFVPVILSSAGRNRSFFTSELTLTNRGDQEVRLDYTYTSRDEPEKRSGKASDVLPAGRQKIETDALDYLRGLGVPIPETGNQLGTLRVEIPLGSAVAAVVRTATLVPEGRAGLAYLGVAAAEGFTEPVYLCGLRQNRQDRSNLAFQNMGAPEAGAITLRATVYSGEAGGATARVLEEMELEPGGFHQYSPVLGSLAHGYVKVERVEGTAPFYAYGVINDQVNSDGSFVFPVTASSLEGKRGQTLPVIVETSEFRSELAVTNFSEEPRTLAFRFVSDQIKADDKTAGFSMTLQGGQQEIIPEVVEELRRRGVAGLGTTRGFYAGPLFVEAEDGKGGLGGDMSGIVIGARTGSEGGGGSYSVFYNAVPEGEAFAKEAWVEGFQQNEENRSNLALVNTGEVDGSASVFHLEIYDGETGMLVETVVTRPIPARRWHQIDGILLRSDPETRQGYVRIEKVSGANPFLAYGVVNDGGAPGERSGDGAYLPARE